MKKIIATTNAPAAIGPYSQAISTGSLIFTSGQLPLKPGSKDISDNIKDQARASLTNVRAILEAAGSSLQKVVKTTVYLPTSVILRPSTKYMRNFFPRLFRPEAALPSRPCPLGPEWK